MPKEYTYEQLEARCRVLEKEVRSHINLRRLANERSEELSVQSAEIQQQNENLRSLNRSLEKRNQEVSVLNETLNNNSERMQIAFEINQAGYWDWRVPEQKILFSAGTAKILGRAPEDFEFQYEKAKQYIHPADLPLLLASHDDLLSKRTAKYELEYRIINRQRHWIWLREIAKVVEYDQNQNPTRIIGMHYDDTENKQAKEKMLESNRMLNTLISNMQGILYRGEIDQNRTMTFLSQAFRTLSGYEANEVEHNNRQSYGGLIHPEDLNTVLTTIENNVNRGQKFEVQYRLRTKRGNYRWVWEKGVGVLQKSGDKLSIEGFITDITQLKQAELELKLDEQILKQQKEDISIQHKEIKLQNKELRMLNEELEVINQKLKESEEKFRQFVQSSPDGIMITNTKGTPLMINPALKKMIGYSLEEMQRIDFRKLTPKQWQEAEKLFSKELSEKGEARFQKEIRSKNGKIIPVVVSGWAINAPNMPHPKYGAYIRDISREKRYEAEREKLIAELEMRNAEQESFNYTVSHDLRSPLITIKGFVGMLQQDMQKGDTERIQSDIKRINHAIDKMENLLNDLLKLSRAGRFTDTLQDFDVKTIIEEVLELLNGQIVADKAVIQLAKHIPPAKGDPRRIAEVFQNLIENALKFKNPEKEPVIEIGFLPKGEKTTYFVRDNGLGIVPEKQNKIFSLFDKIDPKMPGSGVGLALVKRIIEAHNGTIKVESGGKNKGTCFYFSLE